MLAKKKPLSALAAPLKIYPQVLENVRVTDKKAAQDDAAVQAAVKAVAVYLFFTFVIQAVGYVPDVLGIISDAGNLFNAYISVPVLNDIVTLVKDLIYLAEKIFLMVLGVKALNQGTVAVPFVDKLVVKYL